MKNQNLVLTLVTLSAVTFGCERSDTAKQFDKVQTETKQAAQDMKDYTYAQKSTFVESMKGQLVALNRDLALLSAKVEKSSDSAKAEAKPKLQALRDQADKLGQQLDKAQNATESTWEDVKAGSKKAYDELANGFQQARQWVSDKVAP